MAKTITLGSTARRIKSNVEKQIGIMSYDFDNAYTQRIDQAILRSSTGSACDRLRASF